MREEETPSSADDGESMEPGEGPLDEPASKSQPHGVPTDRESAHDDER
jgi:hypothetical protein